MKSLILGLSTATLLFATSLAQAQQENPRERSDRDRVPSAEQKGADSESDRQQLTDYFAGRLMLMNQSTIQMSKMAAERATSPQVKQFAETLVQGHEELNKQLKECAPGIAAMALSESATQHETGFRGTANAERNPGTDRPDEEGAERTPPRGTDQATFEQAEDGDHQALAIAKRGDKGKAVDQILKIERKATENYIRQSTQMLQHYEGQDFDMGYLGFQIGSHIWALAELQALQSQGNEKFQQVVAEATSKVEHHLQEAKEISKALEDDRGNASEDTPRTRRLRQ